MTYGEIMMLPVEQRFDLLLERFQELKEQESDLKARWKGDRVDELYALSYELMPALIRERRQLNEQCSRLQADSTSALLLRRVVAAVDEVEQPMLARFHKIAEIVGKVPRPKSTP